MALRSNGQRPDCTGITSVHPTNRQRSFVLMLFSGCVLPASSMNAQSRYTAIPTEVEALGEYMRRERGLSERWITECCRAADAFLVWLAISDVPLASLKAIDVDRYFAAMTGQREYSRRTIVSYTERLRIFLRFAERRRWCEAGDCLSNQARTGLSRREDTGTTATARCVAPPCKHRGQQRGGQARPRHPDDTHCVWVASRRTPGPAHRRCRLGERDVACPAP